MARKAKRVLLAQQVKLDHRAKQARLGQLAIPGLLGRQERPEILDPLARKAIRVQWARLVRLDQPVQLVQLV